MIDMPKLLKIGAALNCGAPGRIAENIGLLAESHGWDVYMAHGVRHSNPSQLRTIPMVTSNEEKIHALYSFFLDSHGLGPVTKTKKLVEWIEVNKPQIIHLHNIHGYFLNYQVLFEYLATTDIPIVWTLHDCWPFTGHCAHFDFVNCMKWKTGCHHCVLKKDYPKSLIVDHSERNYALKKRLFSGLKDVTIVPVSNWLSAIVRESILREKKINVIHNGVDTVTFVKRNSSLRNQLDIDKNKIVVLGVASPWYERKGLKDYVRLSEYTDLQIVMVGVDASIRKRLPGNIIALSRTSSAEKLAEYYSMADVVTSLSYGETFGMTIAESLACGTPCVVYNNTAQPEIVCNETGRIVETGNIAEVYRNIIELANQSNSIHEKCRDRALKEFDEKTQFMKYVDLYNDILNK